MKFSTIVSLMKNREDKRTRGILPACLLLLILLCLYLPLLPPSLLLVSEEQVLFERVLGEPYCEVDFCHSVNKGNIREIYRLDGQRQMLNLETGYYQSYGAGMIDTPPPEMDLRQEGDYLILSFPANWQERINYIGGAVARHRFIYEDFQMEIGSLRPGKPFSLLIRRRSLWDRWLQIL